jgi:cell division protein FtsN
MILIAVVVIAAVLLLIIGFLAPRFSHKPQRAVDKGLDKADENAKRAPEPLDTVMDKTTEASRKVADKSAETGREARYKSE